MQKVSQIISKPVYSLFEGALAGTVKNFLFNPKTKKISGFFVFSDESENEFFLATNKIYSIGEDSITIRNLNDLEISQGGFNDPEKIVTNDALTIKGDCLGKIVDVFFDEKFSALVFETSSGVAIPSSLLLSVGEDAAIFDLESTASITKFKPKNQKIVVQNLPEIKVSILEEEDAGFPIISNNFNESSFSKGRKIEGTFEISKPKKTEITFPKKLVSNPKSILGKRANKTILGLNGEIIVKDMQAITEKIIEKAKKHLKLFELTNSIEENS